MHNPPILIQCVHCNL